MADVAGMLCQVRFPQRGLRDYIGKCQGVELINGEICRKCCAYILRIMSCHRV